MWLFLWINYLSAEYQSFSIFFPCFYCSDFVGQRVIHAMRNAFIALLIMPANIYDNFFISKFYIHMFEKSFDENFLVKSEILFLKIIWLLVYSRIIFKWFAERSGVFILFKFRVNGNQTLGVLNCNQWKPIAFGRKWSESVEILNVKLQFQNIFRIIASKNRMKYLIKMNFWLVYQEDFKVIHSNTRAEVNFFLL